MTEKEIKIGIVGYGHRGSSMLKMATQGFEGVKAIAICDKNPDLLNKAKKDYPEVRLFTDFNLMLDRISIDALLVETPATHHAKFCSKALRKNIYVMSDVPTVDNVDEANDLWEAQQNSKSFYMLGANPNMWGFVQAFVDLKEKGLLGEAYYIEAEYIHDGRYLFNKTPWRITYETIKYCTHSLGPVLRLIEEDLEWVSCFDTGSHINRKQGQHDAMAALFRTKSNIVIRLLISCINNCPIGHHCYRIYGTKGYFERTPPYFGPGSAKALFYSTKLYCDKKAIELPIAEIRPEYAKKNPNAVSHGGADYVLLDRFFNAIRKGLPSPINLRESLRMSLPGVYAAESARRGGELIKIEYPWSK